MLEKVIIGYSKKKKVCIHNKNTQKTQLCKMNIVSRDCNLHICKIIGQPIVSHTHY